MAGDDELPGWGAALARKARAAGWTVRATYAAGRLEADLDETGAVHYSHVVRLQHPRGHRALVVWTDGVSDFAAFRPAGVLHWTFGTYADVAALDTVAWLAAVARRAVRDGAP